MGLNEKQTFMNCVEFSFIIAFEMSYTFFNKRERLTLLLSYMLYYSIYNIVKCTLVIILYTLDSGLILYYK